MSLSARISYWSWRDRKLGVLAYCMEAPRAIVGELRDLNSINMHYLRLGSSLHAQVKDHDRDTTLTERQSNATNRTRLQQIT